MDKEAEMNEQPIERLTQEPGKDSQVLPRFEAALVFAAQKHKAQPRKGTAIPYISHLMQVSGIALENGANEDEAIAALLYDVIEDQDVTEAELTRRFGPEVAAIVAGCSDSASTHKASWQERKQAYIAHIATASYSVRLVSSCDKLHNARAILADYQQIGEPLWGRFNASRESLLWYYQSLANAFQEAEKAQGEPPSRVVKQLSLVVAELASQVSGSKLSLR